LPFSHAWVNSEAFAALPGNVVASAYANGYWLDIHISSGGAERPDPAPLIELLKEVSIK
jgi:hypothetical protein